MLNTYFIVGTDTDCGKTYVTQSLVRQLQSALAIKPVASGCQYIHGQWINTDVEQLMQTNKATQPICGWLLQDPISPHLAAKRMQIELTASEIVDFVQAFPRSAYEHLLVEGAGGLMVPLNTKETWIDVLKLGKWPVILVVGMRLGCINHSLLTAAVLQQQQIPCLGWIANGLDPHMLAQEEVLETLRHSMAFPCLGTVSYQGQFQTELPINNSLFGSVD